MTTGDESCLGLCNGQVSATVTGGTRPYSYSLNGESINQPVISGLCPGQYIFMVSDSNGCILTDTAFISTITEIHATFEADTTTGYAPLTVHFLFTGTPGFNMMWDFGDDSFSSEQNPSHTYETGGDYLVMLTVFSDSPDICSDTAFLAISVSNSIYIRVYNVITPNGDGMNDYFEVDSEGLQTMNVTIVDRQGTKIYEIKDVHGKWDGLTENGTEAGTGTYFYLLRAQGYDGKDYKKEGVITLLR
jgi:gliding motility-associated-like protein